MEFVSPDPDALVRAANVRATLDAFKLRPSLGERLVSRHELQLEDLRPDKYVPVQRWLDALKEIQQEIGPNVVHRVGIAILQTASFPPQFDTLDALFENMDDIYYMNHKGNVGHYHTSRQDDGVWEIRCATPYPRAFEHGLIEGFSRNRQLTNGTLYNVEYVEGEPASDVTCTLFVRPLGR